MGLLAAHADLHDIGFARNDLPYRLASKSPHLREVSDPIVFFESVVLPVHQVTHPAKRYATAIG